MSPAASSSAFGSGPCRLRFAPSFARSAPRFANHSVALLHHRLRLRRSRRCSRPAPCLGVFLEISGTGFQSGAEVALFRAGKSERAASSVERFGKLLRAQMNLIGAAAGGWTLHFDRRSGERLPGSMQP